MSLNETFFFHLQQADGKFLCIQIYLWLNLFIIIKDASDVSKFYFSSFPLDTW